MVVGRPSEQGSELSGRRLRAPNDLAREAGVSTKRERKREARQDRLSKAIGHYVRALVHVNGALDEHFGSDEREELRRSILGLGLNGLPLTVHDTLDMIAYVVDPTIVRALPMGSNGQVATVLDAPAIGYLGESIEQLILSLPWTYVVAYPLFRCDPNPLEDFVDLLLPNVAPDFAAGLFAQDLPLAAAKMGPVSFGPDASIVKPAAGELQLENEERFAWWLGTYHGYWPQVPGTCTILDAVRRDAQKVVGLLIATGDIAYTCASMTSEASERAQPDDAPLPLKVAIRNRPGERRSAQLILPDRNRANDLRPTRRLRGVARTDPLYSSMSSSEVTCDRIFRARLHGLSKVTAGVGFDHGPTGEARTVGERLLLAGYWVAEATFAATTAANELLFMVLGLEALLGEASPDHGIQDRLADRLAFYIGSNDAERQRLRAMVKDVYALRSRIVHRGIVNHDELILGLETNRLRPALFRAICRLLTELNGDGENPISAERRGQLH